MEVFPPLDRSISLIPTPLTLLTAGTMLLTGLEPAENRVGKK